MKRKLIKQGNNAFTVTLPVTWIRGNNLKAGSEIDIAEEKNKLVIEPKGKPKLTKQEVTIDEHSYDFIRRILTNSYKKGIDELKLVFKKDIPLDIINNSLSELTIGYEVTDVTKNHCIIKSFSSAEGENIEISIRKCFFLIRDMNQIILEDIQSRKFTHQEKIGALNANVRKLTNYAIRTSTKTIKDAVEVQYNSKIFSNLYLFSIKLSYIYSYLRGAKRTSPSTKQILDKLFELFEIFYDSYYKKNLDTAHKFLLRKNAFVKNLDQNITKGDGKVLLQAGMAMRCLHDSIGAVIGLIIH